MVEEALQKTQGVVSTSTTWDMDKVVYNLNIDEAKTFRYHNATTTSLTVSTGSNISQSQ